MIAPEVAEGGASTLGSSKGSMALGAAGSIKPARTSHPYIVGISLVVIGGFSLIGSITGTLPSMLAALFVPNALVDASGNAPAPNIVNYANATTQAVLGNPIPLWHLFGSNYNNLNLNRFVPKFLGGSGNSL